MKRLAVVAAAVVLLTAGCGDEKKDSAEGASDDTMGAQTSQAALTADNFGERIAAAHAEARGAHFTMTMGAEGMEMTAVGDFLAGKSADDNAVHMEMKTGAGVAGTDSTMEMIQVGGIMYMRVGPMTGDKFLKIDPNDPNNTMGQAFGAQAEIGDPTKQFEVFSDAITEFKEVGEGPEIDSVKTTEYAITVDAAKAVAASGGEASELSGMPENLTYSVFVGEDDLIRRMSFDMMGATMSMDFTGWGSDVVIEAPSGDDVTDKLEIPGLGAGGEADLKELEEQLKELEKSLG